MMVRGTIPKYYRGPGKKKTQLEQIKDLLERPLPLRWGKLVMPALQIERGTEDASAKVQSLHDDLIKTLESRYGGEGFPNASVENRQVLLALNEFLQESLVEERTDTRTMWYAFCDKVLHIAPVFGRTALDNTVLNAIEVAKQIHPQAAAADWLFATIRWLSAKAWCEWCTHVAAHFNARLYHYEEIEGSSQQAAIELTDAIGNPLSTTTRHRMFSSTGVKQAAIPSIDELIAASRQVIRQTRHSDEKLLVSKLKQLLTYASSITKDENKEPTKELFRGELNREFVLESQVHSLAYWLLHHDALHELTTEQTQQWIQQSYTALSQHEHVKDLMMPPDSEKQHGVLL